MLIPEGVRSRMRSFRVLISSDKRTLAAAVVVSVILGVASIAGERIFSQGKLGVTGLASLGLLLIEIVVATIVVFLLTAPGFAMARSYKGLPEADYTSGFWALSPLRRRATLAAGFIAVWSVYWVMLWPGSITQDSFRQIIQALHLVPYSDHHPIAHTLVIEGLLTPLVAITNDVTVSLSIITAVQMVVLAAIFALCVDAMREFRLPTWILTATYVLFLLHPLTGWYSVTLWKDIWLGTFVFALGTVSAIIVSRARDGRPIPWSMWAVFALSIVAVAFSKKTGLIIVLPLVAVAVFYLRGRNLVKWVSLGLTGVLAYLAGHALIVAALQVKPGSEAEAWSMPVQQIARTVAENGDSLSATERAAIDEFFNGADIGELYEPWISDPIKKRLNVDLLDTRRDEFVSLWLTLGREHPATYVDATLNQTYGYWYPDVTYWMTSASSWSDILRYNAADKRKDSLEKTVAAQLYIEYNGGEVVTVEPYKPELFPLNSIRRIPIIGWLLSLGAWTWTALVFTAISISRRTVQSRPVSVLMVIVLATCALSPVFAEARYAYPVLLLLPLLGSLTFMRTAENVGNLDAKRKS